MSIKTPRLTRDRCGVFYLRLVVPKALRADIAGPSTTSKWRISTRILWASQVCGCTTKPNPPVSRVLAESPGTLENRFARSEVPTNNAANDAAARGENYSARILSEHGLEVVQLPDNELSKALGKTQDKMSRSDFQQPLHQKRRVVLPMPCHGVHVNVTMDTPIDQLVV